MNKTKPQCRKRNYKTPEEALEDIGMVRALNYYKGSKQRHKDETLHEYYCEECCAWHIGHMKWKTYRKGE